MNSKKNAIVRMVVLAFALLNQLLVLQGYDVLPIAEADLEQAVTLLITMGAALWNWWANRRG